MELSIIGVEEVFCVNIKSFESYCIVKFYKRSDDSAKMIVFRYDGITIVDGATNSLFIRSIVAETGKCDGNRISRSRSPGRVHTARDERVTLAENLEYISGQ